MIIISQGLGGLLQRLLDLRGGKLISAGPAVGGLVVGLVIVPGPGGSGHWSLRLDSPGLG